jgi:hypothetical protein
VHKLTSAKESGNVCTDLECLGISCTVRMQYTFNILPCQRRSPSPPRARTIFQHGPVRPSIEAPPDMNKPESSTSLLLRGMLRLKSIGARRRKVEQIQAATPEFPSPAKPVWQVFVLKDDFAWSDNTRPIDRQLQSSLLGALPLEIREEIYRNVLLSYTDCIHLQAGSEHDQRDRKIFHTPCVTPPDFEQENVWWFRNFRWAPGRFGAMHLPCDLRASKDTGLYDRLACRGHRGTVDASRVQMDMAPYMSLLLVCRRM